MLKSWGWGGVVVAHEILETAQSLNSYFHLIFDLGLDLELGLGLVKSR